MVFELFIDSNVLFEHALERANHKSVTRLFKLAEENKIECFLSCASVYTLSYFLEKEKISNAKEILKGYLSFLQPISADAEIFQLALASSFKDMEDSFQYYAALSRCNYFITFNLKDFKKHSISRLPCLTPDEFILQTRLGS